jgi:hypothetical protein
LLHAGIGGCAIEPADHSLQQQRHVHRQRSCARLLFNPALQHQISNWQVGFKPTALVGVDASCPYIIGRAEVAHAKPSAAIATSVASIVSTVFQILRFGQPCFTVFVKSHHTRTFVRRCHRRLSGPKHVCQPSLVQQHVCCSCALLHGHSIF